MDPTKDPVPGLSSQSQNVITNAEDDTLANLLSGASLECLNYVNVPITRPITGPLHINQMNEYCFLALFDKFPLQQQLLLRAVCKQWNAIIEKKCLGKRSLKLFEDISEVAEYCKKIIDCKLYEDERFKLKPIGYDDDFIGTFKQLQGCAHLFANVEHFVYYGDTDVNKLNKLPEMFPKLTGLTAKYLPQSIQKNGCINLLQHLTSLHLFVLPTLMPHMPLFKSMPILNQLEAFSLVGYSSGYDEYAEGESTFPLLSKLGPKMKSLMLSSVNLFIDELFHLIAYNPALENITTMTLGHLQGCDDARLLTLVCSKFTNLTYLDLKFEIHFDSLKDLCKLVYLNELHLTSIENIPAQTPRHLPQVKSVKKLHIFTCYISFGLARNLHSIFPSIEKIVFKSNKDEFRKHIAEFSYSCSVSCYDKDALFESDMGRHLQPYRNQKLLEQEKLNEMMYSFSDDDYHYDYDSDRYYDADY